MIPKRSDVKARMLALLDDAAGATYTDNSATDIFQEAFNEAYDALFNAFLNYQCPRIKLIVSTEIVPLQTGLVPATLWPDFANFDRVEERTWGSTDRFLPVIQMDYLPQRDMTDRLLDFVWRFDTFFFVGATTARELRVAYESSGTAPTDDNTAINVDGCLTFLAQYAAGVAGPRKGDDSLAGPLKIAAVGPAYEQGKIGGELWRIIQPRVREMQHVQIAPRPYSVIRRSAFFTRTPFISAQQPASTGVGVPADFSYAAGTITGTLDGTNAQFFLAYPVTKVVVSLNGSVLTPGTQYTSGANVVNFIAPYIPQPGADIYVQGWP